MAMYAFYSVITAVVNLVKFRKHGSPILPEAKAINLVAAMVSILSLETEMLAQFGEDDELNRRRSMHDHYWYSDIYDCKVNTQIESADGAKLTGG